MKLLTRVALIGFALTLSPRELFAQDASAEAPPPQQGAAAHEAPLTPAQIDDLVAPIALYPDALVAQILAASTYPTQIVEEERFLKDHPDLKGKDLGAEVDKEPWDPSVKALAQYPSVVADMDKNLSWTSELGDVNTNQQPEVMNSVQTMREKAEKNGKLKSTPEQKVSNSGSTVVIEPTNPEVVYVPVYNPEYVYGYPVVVWPGFYPWWGPGPYFTFGIGFGVGAFYGYGWGWHRWGMDWHGHGVMYGGAHYAYHGRSFYNRAAYNHGNYHGGAGSFGRGDRGLRGYGGAGQRGNSGMRSGAFGGNNVSHGAEERNAASRGRESMGNASAAHANTGRAAGGRMGGGHAGGGHGGHR